MNPTYSTFDTFSIDEISCELPHGDPSASTKSNYSEASNDSRRKHKEPKVIAQLPRLKKNQTPNSADEELKDPSLRTPKTITKTAVTQTIDEKVEKLQQRLDNAAFPLHSNLHHEVNTSGPSDRLYDGTTIADREIDANHPGDPIINRESQSTSPPPKDSRQSSESLRNQTLEKLQIFREGLRLDMVEESQETYSTNEDKCSWRVDQLDQEAKLAIAPETVEEATKQPTKLAANPTDLDHWSDSWLLRLEAAVMPYSRLIVFAAIIAALGLTVILMTGSSSIEVGDTIAPTPMADHVLKTSSLIEFDEEQELAIAEVTSEASSLSEVKTSVTRSSGPQGLPVVDSYTNADAPSPRAELAGNVMPIEPYRTSNPIRETQPAIEAINRLPANYPHTANANSQWSTPSEGGTIR